AGDPLSLHTLFRSDGRRTVRVIPFLLSKLTFGTDEVYPVSARCSSSNTNRLKAEDCNRFFPKMTINTTDKTIDPITIKKEFINKPGLDILKSRKSFDNIEKESPQRTRIIPKIPATPNPGMTNTSRASNTTPMTNIAISQ